MPEENKTVQGRKRALKRAPPSEPKRELYLGAKLAPPPEPKKQKRTKVPS